MATRLLSPCRFLLCLLCFVSGCYPTDSQPPVVSTDPAMVVDEKKEVGDYKWVDEDLADLVLVAEFSFPRVETPDNWRFGLRRIRPDDERSTTTRLPNGFAGDGPLGGYGGSVGISDVVFPIDGYVTVYASIRWSFKDKSEGEFTKDIKVPWMKELKEEVGSGASVHCYFEKPKPPAKR
jgi:hypothetical protein